MKYWHLKRDGDEINCELEVIGPFWQELAYYEDNYVSPRSGPFNPSAIRLHVIRRGKKKCVMPDFLWSGTPPSCSQSCYDAFRDILGDNVNTFPLSIDGEPYVTFVPNQFFDLIDLEHSIYSTQESGLMHHFRRIILRSAPPKTVPIFGISRPDTAKLAILVSDDFKIRYESLGKTGLRFLQAFPLVLAQSTMES